ncbi:MAG: sigma factor-like helix-turn-helix DNA-binding protein [bacterium]|nr:sigma factor-like helix-turn-helix DNA-binding protein [bacterium]
MAIDYKKLSLTLLSSVDERTRDVLSRRFGLQEEEPQTLDAIGQSFGVTRERVRQIEAGGLRQIQEFLGQEKKDHPTAKLFELTSSLLAKTGGFKREDLLLQELTERVSSLENSVAFLLTFAEDLVREKESDNFYSFWTKKRDLGKALPGILQKLIKYLESQGKAVPFSELARSLEDRVMESHLEVAKDIEQTFEGKWGLVDWPEVKPRGVRDRAYIVLKHKHQPLHFREVAQLIDELGLQKKHGPTLVQTVHNELIKDKRFVLVGRGKYALSEWGAEPGTVKDVIVGILKGKAQPMKKDAIIQEVLRLRQVKTSTVLLNLQDRSRFAKDEQDRYSYRR